MRAKSRADAAPAIASAAASSATTLPRNAGGGGSRDESTSTRPEELDTKDEGRVRFFVSSLSLHWVGPDFDFASGIAPMPGKITRRDQSREAGCLE